MEEKEEKKKIITIDLDNKEIYTSNSKIRNLLESNLYATGNLFGSIDINSFKIVKKLTKNKGKTEGDTIKLEDIKNYIKKNKPELLDELTKLENSQAINKKTGELLYQVDGKTPKKISFLDIKKWYYSKFPELNPKKKKDTKE